MIRILRLLLCLIFCGSIYLTSPWYQIHYYICNNINITYLLYILFFISYLIIEYCHYVSRRVNEFILFIYWLLVSIFFVSILYSCFIAFNNNIHEIMDYLIQTKYCAIKLSYSDNYKILFIFYYLKDYLLTEVNIPFIPTIILNMISGTFMELLPHNISQIKQLIPLHLELILYVCKIHDLTAIDKLLFEATPFYQIVKFLKHGIIIAVICKITLFTFPLMILHTIPFMDHLIFEIYLHLLEQNVIFDMTPLEIEDLCRLIALKVIANSPKYSLMVDLLPDILFEYIQTIISYILMS